MKKTIFIFVLILAFGAIPVLAVGTQGTNSAETGKQVIEDDSGVSELEAVDLVEVKPPVDEGKEKILGGEDEYGCIPSAGSSWCPSKQKCLRVWEEDCPDRPIVPDEEGEHEESENVEVPNDAVGAPPAAVQNRNQNQEQGLGVTKAQNSNQLREIIKVKKSELNDELGGVKGKVEQKVFQNQNTVREAVHALLSAENLVGKVGPQISSIARDFNNSVQKTITAEERIQKRGKFMKFLIGGVKDTAYELKQEVLKNKEKIQELKRLEEQNFMQTEVKELLQGQIQNLEQEQNRLGQLADKEISKKGMFGWLINLFK